MTKTKTDDPERLLAFVRKTVRSPIWDLRYHEMELRKAHSKVALVRALFERGQYSAELDFKEMQVSVNNEDDDADDDAEASDAIEFVRLLVIDALRDVRHHEKHLRDAHEELADAKAMLVRGGYTEISLDEIEANVEKSLES